METAYRTHTAWQRQSQTGVQRPTTNSPLTLPTASRINNIPAKASTLQNFPLLSTSSKSVQKSPDANDHGYDINKGIDRR